MTRLTPLVQLFEGPIFNDVTLFLTLVIMITVGVGMVTRKASVALFGGWIVYVHVAIESDVTLFTTSIYPIFALMVIVMGFRMWSFGTTQQGGGEM